MNMKMKPYDEYKKTNLRWLDEIPSHWEVKRGKSIFKREERPVREKDEVVTCFRDGEVTLRRNRRLDGFTESIKEIGYQGIRKGDLVIHQMDAFAGAVGVSDSDGKSTPVYSVCNGMVDLNNYYYAFIIREIARNGYIKSLSRGIRERSTDFRFSTFGKELYPLPPKEEQDNIVTFLDNKLEKIDKFIDLKTRQIELLKEQKEAMINKAVTKGLDGHVEMKDSGIKYIKEIPKYWKVIKLKYLFKIINGATPRSGVVDYWDGSINWITPKDLSKTNRYISESERTITNEGYNSCSTSMIPKENIVMATRAPIGSIRINKTDLCTNQGCKGLIANKQKINTLYSYFLLNTYLDEIRVLGKGTTFPELSTTELSNFKVPVPNKKEQEGIMAYLEKESKLIDETINLYKKEIGLIKEYKTSLISSVVTGKIDVREA